MMLSSNEYINNHGIKNNFRCEAYKALITNSLYHNHIVSSYWLREDFNSRKKIMPFKKE